MEHMSNIFSTSFGVNFAKLTRVWLALISLIAKSNSLLFWATLYIADYNQRTATSMVICSLLIVCTLVKWPLCVAVRTENRFSTVPMNPTRRRSRRFALLEQIPVPRQMDSLVDVGGLLKMMMLKMMTSSYQTTFQFLQLRMLLSSDHRRLSRRLQVSQRSRRRTRVCEYWRVMPRSTSVVSTST